MNLKINKSINTLETVDLSRPSPVIVPPKANGVNPNTKKNFSGFSFTSAKKALGDCFNLSTLFPCFWSAPSSVEKDYLYKKTSVSSSHSSESMSAWIYNVTLGRIGRILNRCLSKQSEENSLMKNSTMGTNVTIIPLTEENLKLHRKNVGIEKAIESSRFLAPLSPVEEKNSSSYRKPSINRSVTDDESGDKEDISL